MTGLKGVTDAERSFAEHEHRELMAGLAGIEAVAIHAGCSSAASVAADLRRSQHWYQTVLRPHAQWEENVLYREMDERAGTEWATRLMRYEHLQIARVAAQLDRDLDAAEASDVPMSHEQVCAIRSHASSLAAMLRAHMEREDKFLFPLLGG